MWQKFKTWIKNLWQLFTPSQKIELEASGPRQTIRKYFYSPKEWAKMKVRRRIAKISRRINKK